MHIKGYLLTYLLTYLLWSATTVGLRMVRRVYTRVNTVLQCFTKKVKVKVHMLHIAPLLRSEKRIKEALRYGTCSQGRTRERRMLPQPVAMPRSSFSITLCLSTTLGRDLVLLPSVWRYPLPCTFWTKVTSLHGTKYGNLLCRTSISPVLHLWSPFQSPRPLRRFISRLGDNSFSHQ